MTTPETPVPGEIYQRDGKHREVVEVGKDIVIWCRPNHAKSRTSTRGAWEKWAEMAVLESKP